MASQLIEEVAAHAQSDSLEVAREICTDGTYFSNNLRTKTRVSKMWFVMRRQTRTDKPRMVVSV